MTNPFCRDRRGSTFGGAHPILQTVRIPLADFPGWQSVNKSVHGIRLTFDQTNQGAIYIANIRLSNSPVNLALSQDTEQLIEEVQQSETASAHSVLLRAGTITAIRYQSSLAQRDGIAGYEIEVSSPQAFPVRDSLLTLRIGSQYFTTSRYAADDLRRVVFSLTAAEYGSLSGTDAVIVQYGKTSGRSNLELRPAQRRKKVVRIAPTLIDVRRKSVNTYSLGRPTSGGLRFFARIKPTKNLVAKRLELWFHLLKI